MGEPTETWQAVANRFQARRAASLPAKWLVPEADIAAAKQASTRVVDVIPRWLSEDERAITALGASDLAAAIRAGTYTSVQVTEAFCHRATIAHQLVNCLTEVFFDEALQTAAAHDASLAKARSAGGAGAQPALGPLHGVPISVKDHYNVAGHYTTAGYVSYATKFPPRTKDAHIVSVLRNAGAVLYAKTNNPQCMMVLETVSNIYGRTLNPYNTLLGPGGSSGGEGALLALHGSPLGVGSDIGGSIRVPACFNGLYGFKPSGKRVPVDGWECTMTGQESITAVAGPLGHSVADLELFFQIVSDAEPWLREPLLRQPWQSKIGKLPPKLAIGVMAWDHVVMPHPYITRTIAETKAKLAAAGHDVVDFAPYDHKRNWDDILLPLYFQDGGLDIQQTLAASGEPMFPSAKRLIDDPIVQARPTHELWKLNIARDVYRTEYLQKWADTAKQTASGKPIDVLICPVAPVQSTPHDVKPWWGYCSQWNLLDYPSSVIPAGAVKDTDAYPAGYTPVNDLDKENMELYDINLYRGMPVTIQIVGLTQDDETVMAATQVIDDVIKSS